MSGIYKGPDGQQLHGDGKPVFTHGSSNSELTALRAENEAFKLDAQRQLCIDRRQHEENLALSELLSCPDVHDERMNHIASLKAREGKMREALTRVGTLIAVRNVESGDYRCCPICRGENGEHATLCFIGQALSTTPPTDGGQQE